VIVYPLPEYVGLAQAIVAGTVLQHGRTSERTFPDGETYLRIEDDVRGKTVVVLGGTIDDRATLGIYDRACALVKYGAERLVLAIPYFGYGTMERASLPGEVVKAKTRARLLSSIPLASHGNVVLLLDLHSDGIPHYFEGNTTARHLHAHQEMLAVIQRLGGKDFVLGATDAGRAKLVQKYANELGVDPAFIIKRRKGDRQTVVEAMGADVGGRRVVMYDDLIRTGSSLISAAKAYRAAGAEDVCAVATHGVFSKDALANILDEGAVSRLVCTDSHPRTSGLNSTGFEVTSIAGLFRSAILDESNLP
jgi:ribose-phosphate pyrophosphokinase